ncbi:MAG: DUF1592 domain-containing protein [Myxococcales bacterium]|nr:MAG: DUF1592 domain-containing protein [Myxococcales bacterium]
MCVFGGACAVASLLEAVKETKETPMSRTFSKNALRIALLPALLGGVACTAVLDPTSESAPPMVVGTAGTAGAASEPPIVVKPNTERGGTAVVPTTQLDEGRVVLRRLNRTEYDNTVRDLLGTASTPARSGFAADDVEDGFDTIGQSLVVSRLLTEQLEKAATTLVDELLARPAADPVRARILSCELTAASAATCLPQILSAFMGRAYRRPVSADEVQSRVALSTAVQQAGGDLTRGLHAALKSVLLSPHFLFRVELGDPASPSSTPLSDYELASRLSYFLWASMPDDTLLASAESKRLSPAGPELDQEVERLLADPKAQGFFESFAGQWLSTREALRFVADEAQFPDYDDALRESLPQETNLFFKSLIAEAQPLSAVVLAKYSFVNERLARHYGLPAVSGGFTRVSLEGTPRIGVLSQGAFLAVSSYPGRTSPVRRANWVLEELLCDPPPSAPSNIPALTEQRPPGATLRQTFEQHRANPSCAACHKIMDPIGFALESFDAAGAYRTTDNGGAVDTTGQLADGTPLTGVDDLARAVAGDADFAICVAKQMLTYAVGRSFASKSAKAYAAGVGVPVKDATWPALIQAVVHSEAFRTRRGETP